MKYIIDNKEIKNVCIVGAGNEGHYLMAEIGQDPDLKISVLTSNVEGFGEYIESHNVQTGKVTTGRVVKVSTNPSDVIPQADIIIFTVPSNVCGKYLDLIYQHVTVGRVVLGFMPGTGGVEFLTKRFIEEKGCRIFGTQRVPSGTKVLLRGHSVNALEKRRDIRVASIPSKINEEVCFFISHTLDIKTIALPNWLSVTFTPSNPILHTSRLYGLFHDYEEDMRWDDHLSFYKNWDNLSSKMLIGCGDELKKCFDKLSHYDLSGIALPRQHYEIETVKGKDDVDKMTKKIKSLIYLKDYAPMVKTDDGKFIPDFNSRYFVEDFPFGLAILRAFCRICNVSTPYIDIVLQWYDKLYQTGFYKDGKFEGEGLKNIPIPQNYGINTIKDIEKYYDRLESLP